MCDKSDIKFTMDSEIDSEETQGKLFCGMSPDETKAYYSYVKCFIMKYKLQVV